MNLLFSAIVTASSLALSAAPAPESPLAKLAEGVYVRFVDPDSNAVANAAVIVLQHGVLVFDSHFTPEAGQALLKAIESVSSKPILFLVNSHYHPDHTHGNQVFAAAHYCISSTNTRRDMLQRDLPVLNRTLGAAQTQIEKLQKDLLKAQDANQREAIRTQINIRQELASRMSRLKIVAPSITFDDAITILDGGREVSLRYLGVGHTDGDIVLYLAQEKLAFVGDLFFNRALPNAQDSILLEWIKTLGELLKLDAEQFIPGHGPAGTRRDVMEFKDYLEELRSMIEPAVTRGETLEQVLAAVALPAKYSGYKFQNFFPANVQKMYAELKAMKLAEDAGKQKAESEKRQP